MARGRPPLLKRGGEGCVWPAGVKLTTLASEPSLKTRDQPTSQSRDDEHESQDAEDHWIKRTAADRWRTGKHRVSPLNRRSRKV